MNKHKKASACPQPNNSMEVLKTRDDALFETLSKTRQRKKRALIRTIIMIVLVLALLLTAVVILLRRQVQQRFAAQKADVQSHVVSTGTISTLVSGSGLLSNVDAEAVTIPSGVSLTEILVKNGDTVEEGQLLATADISSVRSALADIQKEIESLDDLIYDADGETASTRITAGVPGRLKVLYAETGAEVGSTMVENGALAVLSLDGYMALDLETDALAEGDSVTVRLSDGSEVTGSVESAAGGAATILITDDGPEYDDAVTVLAANGAELGRSRLYIHCPLAVTAYAGTVRTVHVNLNAKVSKNTCLFTLKDTAFSAGYDTLLRDRKEAEETLLALLKIQKHGGITAPLPGSVFSVATLDALEADDTSADLLTLSPNIRMSVTISVDEKDIFSLKPDQETDVTVSSVTDTVLTGIVTEIDKTASDGAYSAVITLDKIDGMLPGMSADVDIKIQGVENALLVPADAIHYTSTGAYVYTSYNEETQEYGGSVDVAIGLSNDDWVEITAGLSEGDTIFYTEREEFFFGFGAMGSMGGTDRAPGSNMGSGMPGGRG